MTAADWIAERRQLSWLTVMTAQGSDSTEVTLITDVPVGSFEAAEKFSESLPVALNALEAVLALHGPGEVYISTDDCADPDGHEWHTDVGGYGVCLSEPTGDLYCKGCMYDEYADPADFPWPCPITRAINEALGVSA